MVEDTDTSSDSHQTPLRRSPPSRYTRRTPELKPTPPIPSNVNQMWEKFKSSSAAKSDSEGSTTSPHANHEDLIKLLSNPVQHFVQHYQKELRGEKSKPKEIKNEKKVSTAWAIPAPSKEKESPKRQSTSGTTWDIPVGDHDVTNTSTGVDVKKSDEKVTDVSKVSDKSKQFEMDKGADVSTGLSVQTTFSHEKVSSEKGEQKMDKTDDSLMKGVEDVSVNYKLNSTEIPKTSEEKCTNTTMKSDYEEKSLEVSDLTQPSQINASRQTKSLDDVKKETLKLVLKKLIEKETQTSDRENSLSKSGKSEKHKKKKTSKDKLKSQSTQTLKGEKESGKVTTDKVDSSSSLKQGVAATQTSSTGIISAIVGQEETLLSIPEDSTLESSGFTTSSVDSDGVVLVAKKRNLPNDPKLIKLHRKIQRQKEKYMRDKLREQARKDKIALLEKLLKEKGKTVKDFTPSTGESSTTTTMSSTELHTHLSTPYKHKLQESTDSDTLTDTLPTPSHSQLCNYGGKSPNRKDNVSKDSVCICKPHSAGKSAKSPKQKKTKVNDAIKLKLQEVDYSKYDFEDTHKFQSHKKHKTPPPKRKSKSPKVVKSHVKKMQDFGNTYPSPMVADKRKYGTMMVSEGIQTVPEERFLVPKPREDQGVVSMSNPISKPYKNSFSSENVDPKSKRKMDTAVSGIILKLLK